MCCNLPNDNENDVGNTNKKKMKKENLASAKGSSGINYCLNKMEKLAIPSKVALLQSTNIWVSDS